MKIIKLSFSSIKIHRVLLIKKFFRSINYKYFFKANNLFYANIINLIL